MVVMTRAAVATMATQPSLNFLRHIRFKLTQKLKATSLILLINMTANDVEGGE